MSTIKKGTLTASGEWAKHLRKWGKRLYWKKERKAALRLIQKMCNSSRSPGKV
jgi:hypothetical protein